MRRVVPARAMSVVALLSLSCGGGPKSYRPSVIVKPKPIPVLIWIDPGAKLSEADTLKACEEWKGKGIHCFLVDDIAKSFIQVYAKNGKVCEKNDKDTYTLATAWRGGKIVFNMRCFGEIGKPNLHKFRAVMVHEIGHHLGIWDHVPLSCKDGNPKKHPEGTPICGIAVMNPMYDKDVHFITPVDSMAFDIRDLGIAVIVDTSPGKPADSPDCTYLSR